MPNKDTRERIVYVMWQAKKREEIPSRTEQPNEILELWIYAKLKVTT